MKFTVIGADGFVGSRIYNYLVAHRDWKCERIGRHNALPSGRHCGHIFYCIGVSGDFLQRPLDTMAAHVGVLERVLRECEFDSLLYLSSTRIYQRSASTSETAAITVQPAELSDLYNISKLAGEALCFSDRRKTVRIARLSNVFDDSFVSSTFLTKLFQQVKSSGTIQLHSAPDSAKDYLLVEDMLPLLVNIALQGQERIYNVASGANTLNQAITDVFTKVLKCAVDYASGSPTVIHPPVDVARVAREFSFQRGDFLGSLAGSLTHSNCL
jgi:nucleoside-diphosphate-sugar epimerase